jgi:hypothetical protein
MAALPREFLGLARELRRRICLHDAELNRAHAAVMEMLEGDLRRHRRLQAATIKQARIRWRQIPGQFRAGHKIRSTNHTLACDAVWLVGGSYRHPGWDPKEREPGILLATSRLRATDREVEISTVPQIGIGLHALARWFERTGKRTDLELYADLAPLLTLDGPSPWSTPDGRWVGEDLEAEMEGGPVRLRMVRSYLPETASYLSRAAA